MTMRVWEEAVERYERRIKKIGENPDPTKLMSNKLLYELLRDHHKKLLRAWDAGEPFAYPGMFRILGQAMGLNIIDPTREGDRLGNRGLEFLKASRNLGYPDHGCDRCLASLGVALTDNLPRPSLVVPTNYPCDPVNFVHVIIGRHANCPTFMMDIPSDDTEEVLNYITEQLKELIKFTEENVPGAKYDEDKLVEYQKLHHRERLALNGVHKLRGAIPCPVAGSDTFRMPPWDVVEDSRAAEYAEMYRDELQERVDKGYGAVKGEKLRFAWLVSGPYFGDPWSFLAKLGVSVPFFEFGFVAHAFGFMNTGIWNEKPFGKELTPLQKEARYAMTNIWNGPAEKRVLPVLQVCRDLKIDALVHYQLFGCPNLLGSSQILAERAEQELGIPSLQVEGWELDTEKVNLEEFERKLEDFVTLCLMRKGVS